MSFVIGTLRIRRYLGCIVYALPMLFTPITPYENILAVFFSNTLNFVSHTIKVGTKLGFNVALQVGS